MIYYNIHFLCLFIFDRERERDRERQRETQREYEQERGIERGKERTPSRFHGVSTEPNVGLRLMNCEITT